MIEPVFAAGRALLIGIDAYVEARALPAVVAKDARDVAGLLVASGYDPGAIRVMTGSEATAEAIRDALRQAAAQSVPDETFIFFFSGHGDRFPAGGGETTILLPHDASGADIDGTCIAASELLGLLEAIRSGRQILLLDACHSGGVGTLKNGRAMLGSAGLSEADIDLLAKGRGRVALTSSRPDEPSIVLAGAENSVFTTALLEGMGGGAVDSSDGAVRVFELFSYVAKRVPNLAAQHPVFKADRLEENFAILVHSDRAWESTGAERAPVSGSKKPSGQGIVGTERTALDLDPEHLLARLYPLGPTDQSIWLRAGGDLSRLTLAGHGTAQWHMALRHIAMGGRPKLEQVLATAAQDHPDNVELQALLRPGA